MTSRNSVSGSLKGLGTIVRFVPQWLMGSDDETSSRADNFLIKI